MFDQRLRKQKDRLVAVAVRRVNSRIRPGHLTVVALVSSVGAALAAAGRLVPLSIVSWLASRLFDGLDGALARQRGVESDLGGYLDMLADTVGYVSVPLGIATAQGGSTWTWAAVLLGSFYLNTVSWMYLSSLAEKRSAGAARRGELTSVHMPSGLVEGAETIVLFTLMLALPRFASALFLVMAALVTGTVAQRVRFAWRGLQR